MKAINDFYETPVLLRPEEGMSRGEVCVEAISTVSIVETSYAFKIELAIPDGAVGNCNVRIDEGILIVSGKGIIDLEINLLQIAGKKFNYGHFNRGALFHERLGNEKMMVTCHHRILTIHFPKSELLKELASEIMIN